MKFQYFNTMRTCFLIITALIFWGCPDSASTPDSDLPVGELQFTYLQNDQILYFAIDVATSHRNSPLATAALNWFGTDTTNTPDYLLLNDDGISGDIIKNDYLYSLKEPNDSLTLMNPITSSDTGRVYVEFLVTYGNSPPDTVKYSFYLGNIIPQIDSIAAPDTIVRPSDNSIIFEPVEAKVHDANGSEDIRRVGFVSYHVEGDSFLNEGNIINLYDDGSVQGVVVQMTTDMDSTLLSSSAALNTARNCSLSTTGNRTSIAKEVLSWYSTSASASAEAPTTLQ